MMSDGGKGSGRRPAAVSKEVVDNNWDNIFGKKHDKRQQEESIPQCGCGRSKDPNGHCDGSHSQPSE